MLSSSTLMSRLGSFTLHQSIFSSLLHLQSKVLTCSFSWFLTLINTSSKFYSKISPLLYIFLFLWVLTTSSGFIYICCSRFLNSCCPWIDQDSTLRPFSSKWLSLISSSFSTIFAPYFLIMSFWTPLCSCRNSIILSI